jgi:hypothetical protein
MSLLAYRLRRAAGLLAVPLAALLCACGGGTPGGDTLSRDEFVTRANEICRDAREDAAYPQNPRSDEEFAEALDSASAAFRDLHSRLSALGPPSELESDVEALLRNAEFVADTLEKMADAVRKKGSLAALGMIQVLTETEKEADRLARRIGAADCIGPD